MTARWPGDDVRVRSSRVTTPTVSDGRPDRVVAGSAECTALGVPRQYVDPHDQQPGWTSNLGAQHPRNPERNAPPSARPKVVDTAFWLWNAAVAFFLVSIPVALADEATMSEKLARTAAMRNRPLSPAATSEVVGMMRVGIMVSWS